MIYLLHFSQPVAGQCRHYLGSTDDVDRRLAEHRAGKGVTLTRIASEHGAHMQVVLTVAGDRERERYYKHLYNHKWTRLCPICNPRRLRKFTAWGAMQ